MTIISLYFPILLSLTLSFFLSFMINLFKNNIHSFLGFAGALHATPADSNLRLQCHRHPISSLAGGLGLITATIDVDRPPNVLESATLKPSHPPPPPSGKRDPGGIGFIDDVGGGVDGLMSCTESLGFESSDERRVDHQKDEIDENNNDSDSKNVDDDDDGGELWRRRMTTAESRGDWRRVGSYGYEKKKVKSFPPPISSLNWNGQPSFFLRPVRKDGRLELTEVRIHRTEILHASRHDGRLTLHLIPDRSIVDDIEEEAEAAQPEEEEEEEEEEPALPEEEKEEEEQVLQEEEEEEVIEDQIRYGKEERVGEWRFPSDGFRRCHEVVNQHHHVHGSHHHHHHLRMCGVSIV